MSQWMRLTTLALAAATAFDLGSKSAAASGDATWRTLPQVEPDGVKAHTGSFIVTDRAGTGFTRPRVVDRPEATTGRKLAKVIVVIYDPVLEKEGGKRLSEHVKANDPVQYSHVLVDVIRNASWGYLNYEIVDWIVVDGYPVKVDGFRYDDDSFLEVRRTQQWQPATISYRAVLEENKILERCRDENITDVWLWGASGMHFDEFAFYVPNRYARFGPTDNPWLYRPYDIPPELGHTTWVMGFNYEVGADNMIHSYTHRVESIIALQFADGVWKPGERRDPWNVFSFLEMDFPGFASQIGNCHVPPNGQGGYDYNNARDVLSNVDAWARYPDLRGTPRLVSAEEWANNQLGYQKWILEHLPKAPGATEYGYNNWWVYIANTDEDLPEWKQGDLSTFVPPEHLPAPETLKQR